MADYYELLGISRTATGPEIRSAYARIAKEKHPDRFTDPQEKGLAHAAFQEATTAFNALMNPKSREEYDEELRSPRPVGPEETARFAYERGLAHYEQKQYFEAVELLRTAVQHGPEDARYHAALGRALSRNPHWVREGIQEIEQATKLAPRFAAFQSDLAEVLVGQGLKLRARKAAEAALRLDPQDARARRVIDQVDREAMDEEPPPDAPGGLFGRLRRKP